MRTLVDACQQAENMLARSEGEIMSLLSRLKELQEYLASWPVVSLKFRLATLATGVAKVSLTMVEQHGGKGHVWARFSANGMVTLHWEKDEDTGIMTDHAYWRSRGVTMRTVEALLAMIAEMAEKADTSSCIEVVSWLNRSGTSLELQVQRHE